MLSAGTALRMAPLTLQSAIFGVCQVDTLPAGVIGNAKQATFVNFQLPNNVAVEFGCAGQRDHGFGSFGAASRPGLTGCPLRPC
jgi:hypothetical protein